MKKYEKVWDLNFFRFFQLGSDIALGTATVKFPTCSCFKPATVEQKGKEFASNFEEIFGMLQSFEGANYFRSQTLDNLNVYIAIT